MMEERRIPWAPDPDRAAARLGVGPDGRAAFEKILALAVRGFQPRAWVREVEIEAVGDDFALLGGEWFEGARIAAHIAEAERVFAYVATAGTPPELPGDDPAWDEWLDALGEEAVRAAADGASASLQVPPGLQITRLSPGDAADFPRDALHPLLRLLPETEVSLGEDCLLEPWCSAAGLFLASPRRGCACPHRGTGKCAKGCGGCHATNTNA